MKNAYSLFVLLLLCSSVRVFGAQITTDYDHSATFSHYKTYSWIKVQAGDSLWADRIQHDVDAQLATKGWTKVESNGNASISAFESTQDHTTPETFYDGFGGGWKWRGAAPRGLSVFADHSTVTASAAFFFSAALRGPRAIGHGPRPVQKNIRLRNRVNRHGLGYTLFLE